jgi:hypothetical protein
MLEQSAGFPGSNVSGCGMRASSVPLRFKGFRCATMRVGANKTPAILAGVKIKSGPEF